MTITKLEDLSVELFYEIFIYFQFHEVFNIFSNLNSRFAAIVNSMPLMPVYLGLNAMSTTVTEFYYTHLSQSNICERHISLCVSNELAFDNGLWFASHVSTFNNLRHLSLIDIKRSSFELIINAFSPNTPLIMFAIRFSTYTRAAYTYVGVSEVAYYEQIFHLCPSLRGCDLRFWRYIYDTLDDQIVLSFDEEYSSAFLSHLLEHLPQLEDLSFGLTIPWLPDKHPLMNGVNNQVPEALHILINGLPKLNFLIFRGGLTGGNQQHSKMRDLWKNSTRAYRMECYNPLINIDESILYLWLR
ncbi:unnamed protein product [Rotaria sp. Silwood2]|nr:unnamed protein product [Rotaria sp. Silwood2]